MNPLGLEAKRIGKAAEQRVAEIVAELGLTSHYDPMLDYGGCKTDIVIDGMPFQISVKPKSAQVRKRCRKEGIFFIVAGEQVTREEIIEQIYYGLNYEL